MFGVDPIVIRRLDLPAPSIVFGHAALTALLMLVIHRVRLPFRSLRLDQDLGLVLAMGALLAADLMLFTAGIQRTAVANILALVYLYPLATAILSAKILHERISGSLRLAIFLGLLGTLIVISPHLVQAEGTDLLAAAMGIGVAVLAAIERILVKQLDMSSSSLTVNTYKYLIVSFFFLPGGLGLIGGTPAETLWLLVIGAVLTGVLAGLLVLSGVRKVGATRGAVLGYLEPFVAVILAALVLGERPSTPAIVGGVAIVLSAWLAMRPHREGATLRR